MVNIYSAKIGQLTNKRLALYGQNTPGVGFFAYPPSSGIFYTWTNLLPHNVSLNNKPMIMNSLGSLFGTNAPKCLTPSQLAGNQQINIPGLGPNIIPMMP